LTTKFTQHTQEKLSAVSNQLSAKNKSRTRRLNSMGLLILLLARLLQFQRFTVLPSQGQPRDLETGNSETSCYVHQQGSFRHS
jgi:hypothetical protein